MVRVDIVRSVEAQEWDLAVASCRDGTVFQTTAWAGYMAEYLGVDPYFAVAWEGEHVGARLLLFNEPPGYRRWVFERPFDRALGRLAKRAVPALQWQQGPLTHSAEPEVRQTTRTALLTEVGALARRLGAVCVGPVAPAIHGVAAGEQAAAYRATGYASAPWATFCVDLRRSEAEIWGGLDHSARKAVRRCVRDGLTVRRAESQEDLRQYHEAAVEMGRLRGARRYSVDNLRVMWTYLKPLAAVDVFLAEAQGRFVGGLGVWTWNGIINEFGVARTAASLRANLGEGDLLKWEILRWGQSQGHRVYDLSGYRPEGRDAKEEGIYRFKRKWGGDSVHYCMYWQSGPGLRGALWRRLRRHRASQAGRGPDEQGGEVSGV